MSSDGGRTGEMTLVFTLAAIERFADPAAVFEEAREWSRYVGIVDNDTDAVDAFGESHLSASPWSKSGRTPWLSPKASTASVSLSTIPT